MTPAVRPSILSALVCFAAPALAWSPAPDDARWAPHAFEHPCADVHLPAAAGAVYCAADGAVGAVEAPVDLELARQFEAQPRWTWTPPGAAARQRATTVLVAGEFVVVHQVTCGACRRVMGRAWAFRPATAPADRLALAQAAAGLPARPLLRTVRTWEDARPAAGTTGVASRLVVEPARR